MPDIRWSLGLSSCTDLCKCHTLNMPLQLGPNWIMYNAIENMNVSFAIWHSACCFSHTSPFFPQIWLTLYIGEKNWANRHMVRIGSNANLTQRLLSDYIWQNYRAGLLAPGLWMMDSIFGYGWGCGSHVHLSMCVVCLLVGETHSGCGTAGRVGHSLIKRLAARTPAPPVVVSLGRYWMSVYLFVWRSIRYWSSCMAASAINGLM